MEKMCLHLDDVNDSLSIINVQDCDMIRSNVVQ